ncbi:hypothetical protein [Flammeovirga sp. EKP202]|uniref:hypothetical protein n=1 Tax=Flammeovirga sp. EKP202 TaxID=2770592 RepID=UPI00165F4256|nr:hypothetical protein [Flammeovirga sp. EKP202]MBD0405201.1 hypothetical protein [Flammeovirga sp. EKP202]
MISQRYRTLLIKLPIGLLMLSIFMSCFGEPEFPKEPEIEFAWIENHTPGERFDSLYIGINFKDGDGDLGLDQSDTLGPYAPYEELMPGDSILKQNKYHFNYFVTVMKKEEDGEYRMVEFDSLSGQNFNGRFPMLNNSGRERPLEGELRYYFTLFYDGNLIQSPVTKGDSIKIKIQIVDRALNESNEIISTGVEVGTPQTRDEGSNQPPIIEGD